MPRRAALTAHISVRAEPPVVELSAPDWHTIAFGIDARMSMDTKTLQQLYTAIRAHLRHYQVLPLSLEDEADEARELAG